MSIKKVGLILGKLGKGAFNNLAADLSKGLQDNGVEEIYIYSFKDNLIKEIFPEKVRFVDLKSKRIRYMIFELYQAIKKTEPDLLISFCSDNNIVSLLIKRLFRYNKSTLLISDHQIMSKSYNAPNRFSIKLKSKVSLMKTLYPYCDGYYTISKEVKDDILKTMSIKIPLKRVLLIDNAVDSQRIIKLGNGRNPYLKLMESTSCVVSVGRLQKEKNHELLIKAFKRVLEETNIKSKLFIIGRGPQKSSLLNLIKELNLENQVILTGFLDNPYPLIKDSKMMVLPSLHEPWGLVLAEAMTLGIPIIATDAYGGGPKNILSNGKYGCMIANQDEIALAREITKMLKSKKTHTKYSKLALQRAEDFSPDKIAKKLLQFNEVLRKK
jgi:glycosyltransferase involved in cell wall biosynthesis